MAEPFELIGFRYSVYTRIVRIALIETGTKARYLEVDPFAGDAALDRFTPLGKVPVLRHGNFTLTETAAILRYLARITGCGHLLPEDPRTLARMEQVMGVADSSLYWPLVRQVFSHGFYGPLMQEAHDPRQVAVGLEAGRPGLELLDAISAEGLVLGGESRSLADLHLAPMIDYFTRVQAGAEALAEYPALCAWWRGMADSPMLLMTEPFPSAAPPVE
ncbi:Glutathione S-transferase [Sulfitobacter sp. THAF37]|uniref:glutathione S-transferase family protein n=1 Tax=Sulfitobacter sp. THAF37 TaxID=2587855 RepID=UPI0012686A8D|nr:glutathione S-transferase family protein [Sulfitobacter sp. THAF37]QFT57978.1 Glutathione S-transferase [Sulfitobacter sp. THAF37]